MTGNVLRLDFHTENDTRHAMRDWLTSFGWASAESRRLNELQMLFHNTGTDPGSFPRTPAGWFYRRSRHSNPATMISPSHASHASDVPMQEMLLVEFSTMSARRLLWIGCCSTCNSSRELIESLLEHHCRHYLPISDRTAHFKTICKDKHTLPTM